MEKFRFKPSPWVPYGDFDPDLLARLRAMTPEELVKHPNPELKIIITKQFEGRFCSPVRSRANHSLSRSARRAAHSCWSGTTARRFAARFPGMIRAR